MKTRSVLLLLVALVVVVTATILWQYWERLDELAVKPSQLAESELKVGLAGLGDLNTLDPAQAGTSVPILIVWQMYERLVGIDESGKLVPMLATSWKPNTEMNIWEFQIRKDARFHGEGGQLGRLVTPADVKASLLRSLGTPGFAQTLLTDVVVGAEAFSRGKSSEVEGIQVDNDRVTFRLVRPFAFLPERLAASFLSIVPAGTPLNTDTPPPGSGPYRFVQWDRTANRVTLERVAQTPAPRRLTFIVFENEGVAVEEIRRGELDWLETTSAALPLLSSLQKENFTITTSPQLDIRLVALNQERSPFIDYPEAAVALNLATNRKEIIGILGGGEPVAGPVPGGPGLEFEPTRATAIVRTLPESARALDLLVMPGAESRTIAELLKQQWEKVGFRVALRPGLADFFDKVIAGNYQAALAYYGPFVPVAEQYLWPYRAAAQPIPNAMRFSSPPFETVFERYTGAQTRVEGEAELAQAVQILLRHPPVVWLVRAPQVIAGPPVGYSFERWSSLPVFSRPHSTSAL